MADAGQGHRGRVLDLAELVEDRVDAADDGGEGHHALRQAIERRVGVLGGILVPSYLRTFVPPAKVTDNICYRLHRAPQVPHLVFLQVRALQADAGDGLAHVKEILHREVAFLFLQTAEFTHLKEPFVDLPGIGGEGHFVYLLLAQRTEAALFQQPPYLVES